MAYLEEHSYIHRDLIARYVLISERKVCKIAEFGQTIKANAREEDVHNPQGIKFPVRWTAPEAALSNQFSSKSDVWSFGVVISEVFTRGALPYPGMANRLSEIFYYVADFFFILMG